jgi:serine/threonine protein phosphatase PrpC
MERPPAAVQLEVGQFSHPGRKRKNNEDWLGTYQPEDAGSLSAKGSLFLVADGMGGHQSGEMASRLAVHEIIRHYKEDPGSDVAASLQQGIELANEALYGRAQGIQARRWGTTLVAAVIRSSELWLANVGDSRAYLLRNRELLQLSRDHSLAAELGSSPGEPEIARHVITRALGLKPRVDVDMFPPFELHAGDRILLCSDGLTTPLSDREIRDIAVQRGTQAATEELVRAANSQGGPDNISVILIQVTGPRQARTWDTPRELLAVLTRPETWQPLADLPKKVARGEQDWRSPVVIGALLLITLALIGLGFALGLLIFGLLG